MIYRDISHFEDEVLIDGVVLYSIKHARLSSLKDRQQFISLDNLESTVLKQLVASPDELITYEEFFAHWRSPDVIDSALTRVISLLRKKLREAGLASNAIKNTPKKGYTFTAKVMYGQKPKTPGDKPPIQFEQRKISWPSVFIAFLVCLLFTGLYLVFWSFENLPPERTAMPPSAYSYRHLEPLNGEKRKLDFALNHETGVYAFALRDGSDNRWRVDISDLKDGHLLSISIPGSHVRNPAWISASELVMRIYNNQECSIVLARIMDSEYSLDKLFSCNAGSYFSANAYWQNRQILFSDADLNGIKSNVYIGDIDSGQTHRLQTAQERGSGVYSIVTFPGASMVALLSSDLIGTYRITLVDAEHEWREIWSKELTRYNESVAWDGKHLSYVSDGGAIVTLTFDGKTLLHESSVLSFDQINNVHTGMGYIGFTAEDVAKTYFSLVDLHSENVYWGNRVFSKMAHSHKPAFINDSYLAYMSDIAGVSGVWLYSLMITERLK